MRIPQRLTTNISPQGFLEARMITIFDGTNDLLSQQLTEYCLASRTLSGFLADWPLTAPAVAKYRPDRVHISAVTAITLTAADRWLDEDPGTTVTGAEDMPHVNTYVTQYYREGSPRIWVGEGGSQRLPPDRRGGVAARPRADRPGHRRPLRWSTMIASAADLPVPPHLVRKADDLTRELEELKADPDSTPEQRDDLYERIVAFHALVVALKPCGCGTSNEPDRTACWRCGNLL